MQANSSYNSKWILNVGFYGGASNPIMLFCV